MKRYVLILALFFLLLMQSAAAQQSKVTPNQLFYEANAYYQKGEYTKAIESYIKILDMGLESGSLYYNIGNGFFKLGKTGYAILCYERAKRLIPQDGDLKSNLAYAKSLAETFVAEPTPLGSIAAIIKRPFDNFNLHIFTVLITIFYLIVVAILIFFIAKRAVLRRKHTYLFITILSAFTYALAAYIIRYYDEEILKHGIIIEKEAECKYEPIENSTTYYTLKEGSVALILKTRDDWRQIKRLDGKIAWVKKEGIEEI